MESSKFPVYGKNQQSSRQWQWGPTREDNAAENQKMLSSKKALMALEI
jgi:hypothetical protein